MSLFIHELEDKEVESYLKAVIYGEPGIGKSYLAVSAANYGKMFFLITEPDVTKPTLKRAIKDLKIPKKNIVIADIMSWSDLVEAFSYLEEHIAEFKVLGIDSVLDLNRRLLERIIHDAKSRKAAHDPDLLEYQDWYRAQEKMRTMIREFRDLPLHVIMTTLVMDDKQDSCYRPMMQPKGFAREFAQYFNTVGYLTVERDEDEVVRRLQVTPDGLYVAKNPGGLLPDVVEAPDMAEIIRIYEGGNQ